MGLTVFQQKAVCNAYHQLTREGGSGRFLIADEVGLGKTIIAREIIRKFLEKTSKRAVTVVYICSNQLLARKNLGKLTPKNIADWDIESYPASRLSLLALDHPHLINPRSKAKEGKICYFYALTPGTSLSITSGSGTVRERMMLYLLSGGNFDKELDPDAPEELVKTYGMHKVKVDKSSNNNADDALEVYKGWETIYEDIRNNDPAQSKNPWIFLRNLFADPKIIEELAQSIERLKNQVRSKEKIFEQRKCLAQFGASLLKPNLVIFDEFQNYENIFIEKKRGGDEEELAARAELDIINTVFTKLKPKYLLLSATPFAPLTMNDEISRGEVSLPSCDAFTRLVEWLVRAEDGKFAKQWKDYAELFKRYCRNPDESKFEAVKKKKDEVEQVVRSVMSRTERDASRLRDLVQEIDKTTSVLAGRAVDRKYIFKSRQGEPYTTRLLEFEKYALRPLSAMRDDYTFIKAKERKNNPDCFLAGADHSKSLETVMRHPYFQCLDQALGEGRIDYPLLFWMPPTVPFYKLKYPFDAAHAKGFSKILIFSAWRYIPRMISAAMSNHVERKIWENNAIPKKLEAYHFFVPNVAGEVNLNADARPLLDAQYDPDTPKEDWGKKYSLPRPNPSIMLCTS